MRQVILVQACVRRWLAKRVFARRMREHKMMVEMARGQHAGHQQPPGPRSPSVNDQKKKLDDKQGRLDEKAGKSVHQKAAAVKIQAGECTCDSGTHLSAQSYN